MMRIRKRGARLGQHFLKSSWVAGMLAESARIEMGDSVLEVGPGTGALTGELLKRSARVIAVEKDETLAKRLSATFVDDVRRERLTIIHGDIRNITPESLGLSQGEYIVAANIPYYITGEIFRLFLSAHAQPKTMALLVQKEVAERIARSKKESILSLSVKVYGTPMFVKSVSRGNFFPPPSVDSAILSVTNISRKNFKDVSENKFFRLVKTGFAAKRKMLRVNLAKISLREDIERAFSSISLPLNIRAEDVPLETWLKLAKELR